ncbi:hypothetical protein SAMN05880592_12230 [Bosea sp. TND4EK4]|jgi:transposase-like protein|nr:hypothetical protein SAMN05880592_12230 [Bosea sp. TND4EK4]
MPEHRCFDAACRVLGKTIVELARQFDVHPSQIMPWRNPLLDGAVGVFDGEAKVAAPAPVIDVKTLYANGMLSPVEFGRQHVI